jgi:hypothetical protein
MKQLASLLPAEAVAAAAAMARTFVRRALRTRTPPPTGNGRANDR